MPRHGREQTGEREGKRAADQRRGKGDEGVECVGVCEEYFMVW